jgi:hypothetical protein
VASVDLYPVRTFGQPVLFSLMRNVIVTGAGTSDVHEGFESVSAMTLSVVANVTSKAGEDVSLSVSVEHSADGDEWATLHDFGELTSGTFEALTVSQSVSSVDDRVRVVYDADAGDAFSVSVNANVTAVASGGGGFDGLPDPSEGNPGDVVRVAEVEGQKQYALGAPINLEASFDGGSYGAVHIDSESVRTEHSDENGNAGQIEVNGKTPGVNLRAINEAGTVMRDVGVDLISVYALLPTSDPGLPHYLWNDNGTVKVSAGYSRRPSPTIST